VPTASPPRLHAFAKINLTLEVLGKRADGYHEVRTILQTVDLADTLTFEDAEAVSLRVSPKGAAPVEGNLVLRAAGLLQAAAGARRGGRIVLRKRIPPAAGLGGGSSDAATALLGLRALWRPNLGDDALRNIAARLGSDVPFFLVGGTALGEGRGDAVTPLPAPVERWAVLIAVGSTDDHKTATLYGLLRPEHWSPDAPRTAEARRRLEKGEPLRGTLFNAFDAVVPQAYPAHERVLVAAHDAGLRDVHLAGAGPSLFALTPGRGEARSAASWLRRKGWAARAVRLVGPRENSGMSS